MLIDCFFLSQEEKSVRPDIFVNHGIEPENTLMLSRVEVGYCIVLVVGSKVELNPIDI